MEASALPRASLLPALLACAVAGPPSGTVDQAEAARLLGEPARALVLLEPLLRAKPDDLAAQEVRVHALLDDGRWRDALHLSRELNQRLPGDLGVQTLLAETLYRAGRLDEVDSALGTLDDRADAPARALLTLGSLRDAQGRTDEALKWMGRAVARAPGDRDVLYRAAGVSATRNVAADLLRRYLERSSGDDEETVTAARQQLALYEALGERAIWGAVRRPERLELPLKPLWVPETGEIIGYMVQARIGPEERTVSLLLDSGSPGLFVIERIARKCGFAALAEVTVRGGGGSGRHEVRRGFFSSFALGPLEFKDALASAAKQELDPLGRFHGLVGLSIFNGYRVTLDLRGRRLRLERDAEALQGEPYYTVAGQLLVRAQTSGGGAGLFLLDSGSTRTLVAEALLAEIGGARIGPRVELPAYGGARRGARALEGFEVRFCGHSSGASGLAAVALSLPSEVGGVEVSGFVGLDLLDGQEIVIDTVRRTVGLAP